MILVPGYPTTTKASCSANLKGLQNEIPLMEQKGWESRDQKVD